MCDSDERKFAVRASKVGRKRVITRRRVDILCAAPIPTVANSRMSRR